MQVEVAPGACLPVHVSGTAFPATDMLVPWKKKNKKGGADINSGSFVILSSLLLILPLGTAPFDGYVCKQSGAKP